MVQAACAGAQSEGSVDVRLLHATQAGAQDLLSAQGYLFATPENLAAISGLMKDFLTEATMAHSIKFRVAPMPA